MTTDEIRAILTAEATLRIDLKVSKARAFLRLIEKGVKTAEAWQVVAIEIEELERTYERANIERLALYLTADKALPTEDTP